jgi:Terminase small subunit
MTDNGVPAVVPAAAGLVAHPVALTKKRELFAQRLAALGNATEAYRRTYRRRGASPAALRVRAHELAHSSDVAARVRQLLAESAGDAVVATQARMARLQAIVEADPAELVRVVRVPCPACWPAAEAQANAEQGGEAAPLQGAQDAPREGCLACHGDGARQVVITPTDDLSPAARMLLKGVRQKATGEIEVRLHDQLTASDQLNRMQGSYAPDRSLGLTAHVNVDFSTMTLEQQADFIRGLGAR